MTNAHKPPAGATHVAELRPRTEGSGFEIVSRARIIGWQQDTDGTPLPVTAYGVVSRAAFRLSAADPGAGCSFIECRDKDGVRGWTLPGEPLPPLPDAKLRKVLRRAIDGKAPPQPAQDFAVLPPEERLATVARMRAVQTCGSTVSEYRRELEAIKRRCGMGGDK